MVTPPTQPSVHQEHYQKLFGPGFLARQNGPAKTPSTTGGLCIFICFTNRSGSSFLCEALSSSGDLPHAKEHFNHRTVAGILEREQEIRTFPDYCRWLIEQHAMNGNFSVKTSAKQLFLLCRSGMIPAVFTNNRFIFIRRRDLLAQAISLADAQRSGAWKGAPNPDDQARDINVKELVLKTSGLATSNALFDAFFALNDVHPFTIYYEDLVADPEGTIASISAWLERPRLRFAAENVTVSKHDERRKSEWRKTFLEMAAKYPHHA
jgi:LPS sulfotransferase NodH